MGSLIVSTGNGHETKIITVPFMDDICNLVYTEEYGLSLGIGFPTSIIQDGRVIELCIENGSIIRHFMEGIGGPITSVRVNEEYIIVNYYCLKRGAVCCKFFDIENQEYKVILDIQERIGRPALVNNVCVGNNFHLIEFEHEEGKVFNFRTTELQKPIALCGSRRVDVLVTSLLDGENDLILTLENTENGISFGQLEIGKDFNFNFLASHLNVRKIVEFDLSGLSENHKSIVERNYIIDCKLVKNGFVILMDGEDSEVFYFVDLNYKVHFIIERKDSFDFS